MCTVLQYSFFCIIYETYLYLVYTAQLPVQPEYMERKKGTGTVKRREKKGEEREKKKEKKEGESDNL